MMTKRDFQQFADAFATIKDNKERENIINICCPIFKGNNFRFDESKFKEWIDRRIEGKSTKGLG